MTSPFMPRLAVVAVFLGVAACSTTDATTTGTPVASGIGVSSGSAQSAVIGTALAVPLVVHVTDQYGAAIAGVAVTFTTTTGINVGSSSATTDTAGNAQTTASFTGTVAGTDTVTASVSGVTVPARFFETALASVAVSDSITNGNNQTGTSGTALPLPLSLLIKDQYGNLVVGDTVTWTASAGTLSTPTSVTDATGTASVMFTPAAGTNTVTGAVNGTALAAVFTETGD